MFVMYERFSRASMNPYLVIESRIDKLVATGLYDRIGSWPELAARSPFIAQCRRTPGGFLPLEMIYDNRPVGDTLIQRLADRYYLNGALCRGARVRLRQATHWLRQQIEDRLSRQESASVLSLASGGARDVIDAVGGADWADRVRYLGVDLDPQAVTYAHHRALAAGLNGRFRFEMGNALRPPRAWENRFDIVTSLGLFDYLRDSTAVRLLDRIHALLRPGGALLFGMVTSNPNQRFFEDYLNWRMIYRSPEHILGLARASKFEQIRAVSNHDDYFFLVACQRL